MRIVGVACVRDELDIIEAFVRHTTAHTSRLIVLDNGSTDGTLTVLRALQDEGLPLDVVQDPALGQFQSQRMTRLLREAVERCRADWVLLLDADEFLVVHGDGPVVPENAPTDAPINLPWCSYVPDAADDPHEPNPVARIRHRLVQEGWPWKKVVVPAALAARQDAVVGQGNHAVVVRGEVCPGIDSPNACLAHFPIRSRGQFLAKMVIGHLQNEVMTRRDPNWSYHQRDAFEWLKKDPSGCHASYASLARRYAMPEAAGAAFTAAMVEEPLPYRGAPCRHTPALSEDQQTWPPVLRYVQALAREYALLNASLTEDGRLAHERFTGTLRLILEQLTMRDDRLDRQREERLCQAEARNDAAQARLGESERELRRLRELLASAEARLELCIAEREALASSITCTIGKVMLTPLWPLRRRWRAWRRSEPSPS